MVEPSPTPASHRAPRLPAAQGKLAAAIVALVVLVLVVSGWAAELGLRARERARLESELEQKARLVRELLASAERGSHAAVLRAAGASGLRVSWIAPDGTVQADSDVPPGELARLENHAARPEVAEALAGRVGRDLRRSESVERPFLYLAIPSADAPGAGVIRVAADYAAVERQAAALRAELLQVGAVALLVVLPLAFWLSQRALRPLRDIARAVDSIAQGNLEQRLPRGALDELGRIALGVNAMAEQLRARLRELTEDKERLQAVLSGMVEGVLVVDAEERVVLANPRLRELFGFRGDAAGRPHWEVVRRAEVHEAIAKAAVGAEPVVADVRTEGADPRHLQLHAVRFPASGTLLGVVTVLHDVTEIRRLEGMRRDFVANVSHELKTPLTAIRGFAETLRGGGVPPPQQAAYLDVVLRHAERLARLIDDILELSRIEGRQQPFHAGAVDVPRVTTLLLRDMQPQLEARHIQAALAPGARGVAHADRGAVEQILSNLLDNAIKYTEEGGHIQVRVAEGESQVRLEVEDDGIGIPPDDLPRVFERFYRVDKARSRDLGGTGLGLAIVKHLAQAQGGEVSARSAPGRGSTFTVVLPRHA